jgi:hypothetical protein
MKRILLTTGLALSMTIAANAQVIFAGVSPASIEGNYDFTWADPSGGDWGSPDFNIPGTYVQDTLMMVDDGSTGTNPQGNPVSAEGCNELINDLTGKIAVIYRNTCEFGMKARNAEHAGAVGVIIINREDELVNMGGGDSGFVVTIPVVFIKSGDGAALVNEMQNGPVVCFMGNRAGLYANDLSMGIKDALLPKAYAIPEQLALNDGEVAFDLGMTLYNYGYADQDSAIVRATVSDPNGNIIYDEEAGPFSLTAVDTNSGGSVDSVIIMPGEANEFPMFTLTSPAPGRYTVTYTAYNGSSADDFADDNEITSDLLIGQDFAYCAIDENNEPQTSAHYRPSGSYSSYSACISFSDPNAARIGVDGLWFSAAADDSLTNQSFYVKAFQWNDAFVDLDDPNLDFVGLDELESTVYTFMDDSQETFVYAEFENDIQLSSDQRYLFCVQTFNPSVYIGFDTRTQYLANQALYRQPIGIVEVSSEYDPIGFEADVTPSLVLGILDSSEVVIPEDTTPNNTGIKALASFELNAYPNPTRDQVLLNANIQGQSFVTVTDIAGKQVMSSAVNFDRGRGTINMSDLRAGIYLINVTTEDGRISQTRVVKQ